MATIDEARVRGPDASAAQDADLPIGRRHLALWAWIAVAVVLALGIGREFAAAAGQPTASFGYLIVALDAEANLPTYLSSLLLLSAAALLLLRSRIAKSNGDRDALNWGLLSLGFLYLSLDEVAQLHESIKAPLRALATFTDLLAFPWVVVAIPAVALAAIYFSPFLLRLAGPTRVRFVVAGLIYVAGAIGMEMVNGRLTTYTGWGSDYYLIGMFLEEALEFTGVTLFVSALLKEIAATGTAIRLRVT